MAMPMMPILVLEVDTKKKGVRISSSSIRRLWECEIVSSYDVESPWLPDGELYVARRSEV